MDNKKVKIFLVEDEQLLREICRRKLTESGFEVTTAVDGGEALKKIKNDIPDLILLDIVIPTMDGFEILKRIRSDGNPAIAGIPVVILSNLGQDSDIEKAMYLGANDYIIKVEFTTDEIAARIKEILGKQSARS